MSYDASDLIDDLASMLHGYGVSPSQEFGELWHIAEDVEVALMQRRDLIEALKRTAGLEVEANLLLARVLESRE